MVPWWVAVVCAVVPLAGLVVAREVRLYGRVRRRERGTLDLVPAAVRGEDGPDVMLFAECPMCAEAGREEEWWF